MVRAKHQTVRDNPYAPKPDEIIQTNLSLLTLPCPFLPVEITVKALTHVSPSLCLLTSPGASPCGPAQHAMPLVSRDLTTETYRYLILLPLERMQGAWRFPPSSSLH
ncbi:hypothetical protein H8959_008308 [Pygathrix nigripes]